MIVGNARVSNQDQNLQMQLDALQEAKCFEIFEEKMTGTKKDRPALNEMLKMLRPGDRVVVYKLDRISRSTKHLIELAELFEKKEVEFFPLKDSIDTSTAMESFFRVRTSIAELERGIISERRFFYFHQIINYSMEIDKDMLKVISEVNILRI